MWNALSRFSIHAGITSFTSTGPCCEWSVPMLMTLVCASARTSSSGLVSSANSRTWLDTLIISRLTDRSFTILA